MRKKFKYKGKTIADGAFIINLPYRTDRKESATNLMNELGFTGWEFFEGVKYEDPYWHKWGCTQSFINIFKLALDENLNSIVIFEDDVRLTQNIDFNEIDNVFMDWKKNTKKYDLVGMGTRPLENAKIYRETKNFGRVTNCVCAHAWYFKKKFIKYFYNEMKDIMNEGSPNYRYIVDEFINDCCSTENRWRGHNKLFKVGITIPLIFSQSPGYSDNECQVHDYRCFIEDLYVNSLNRGDEILKNNGNKIKIK
jgi:GR25 family glycosyltransferase involved in LPS biosynthesis